MNIANVLLGAGAQVTDVGEYGLTPLLGAALQGHTVMVEYLLQQASDIKVGWAAIPLSNFADRV